MLEPFEASGDVEVLYRLAFIDSLLGKHDVAMREYRRAFAGAGRVADLSLVAKVTSRFAYELYHAAQYAEAVSILDALLRAHAGALQLDDERDARLRLARALDGMGDGPAAEAELARLRAVVGAGRLTAPELLLDAQLHTDANQLRSAEELLQQAQAAAQRDGIRLYEASATMNRIEVAARASDWQQVHALSAHAAEFGDVLATDDRVDLAFFQGIAARGEGRLQESRRLLEQALGLGPVSDRRWGIESELGLTQWALGDVDAARRSLENSISQLESQKSQFVDPSQASPVGGREKPYQSLFELFATTGDSTRALSILQRSLASRLGDEVATASSGAGHEVSDALERNAAAQKLDEASRGLPERASQTLRDARFVAFVTTEAHSWAFIHSPRDQTVVPVALAPQALCALMQKFGEDFDEEAATALGAALFPPTTLERLGPRFAVILPACARSFPVAAVRVGDARLVDRAVISVAPDVSTVTFGGATSRDGRRADKGLVLADPLGDLPFAREEAASTGRATAAEVRLGRLASQEPMEHQGAHLLHFSTHTVVDVAGPALVLADHNVTVADILRRRLHADLVVLASCHSGSRLASTAAETLSTAFLRAGSGAVLATLRSVEDAFALDVVRAFYSQGGLEDPAGALARVQRVLSRTEPVARWSAFFVAGTPEALAQPRTL